MSRITPPVVQDFDLEIVREARAMSDAAQFDVELMVQSRDLWALVHVIPCQSSVRYDSPGLQDKSFYREYPDVSTGAKPVPGSYTSIAHDVQILSVLNGSIGTSSMHYSWSEMDIKISLPYNDAAFWSKQIFYPYITKDGYAIMHFETGNLMYNSGYVVPSVWLIYAEELKNPNLIRSCIATPIDDHQGEIQSINLQINPYLFSYLLKKYLSVRKNLADSDLDLLLATKDPLRRELIINILLSSYNPAIYQHILSSAVAEEDPAMTRHMLCALLGYNANVRASALDTYWLTKSRDEHLKLDATVRKMARELVNKITNSAFKEAVRIYMQNNFLVTDAFER